jgi:uncharacterized membrane protein YeaQ/YmgE (transglycosylase-associated protein family)
MPEGRQLAMGGHEQEGTLMGFIIWLIVGGVVGWLASLVMRTDGQQGIILNIVVGVVGSVIANFIFNRQGINGDPMSMTAILYSLLGAIILLAVVNLVRRGSIR